jgi:NADPH:quinone reductase-like Zn-dependent oxidoreductase
VVEVGGARTLPRSLRALRIGGTIAQIGVLTGKGEGVEISLLLHRQVRLRGIYVGSRADFEMMSRDIIQHQLKPVVDEVFGFANAAAALRTIESGAHFGKLVTSVTH